MIRNKHGAVIGIFSPVPDFDDKSKPELAPNFPALESGVPSLITPLDKIADRIFLDLAPAGHRWRQSATYYDKAKKKAEKQRAEKHHAVANRYLDLMAMAADLSLSWKESKKYHAHWWHEKLFVLIGKITQIERQPFPPPPPPPMTWKQNSLF